MKKILLLNGPPRSGKDTVADLIARHVMRKRGIGVDVASLAEPIYEAVAKVLGWSVERVHREKDAQLDGADGMTPRKLLITIGEDIGRRTIDVDHWSRLLWRRWERTWVSLLIVPDVGFHEEQDFFRRLPDVDVRLWHVERPPRDFSNDSRSWVMPRDFTIRNDGTRDQLGARAVAEVERWYEETA